ncbi:fructose-1,6-bisphosphatase [Gemmiger formicilis]|uniref:fructose-1,6-bisphosphatase n=1 Tax=Gemmiger formicilis TaxID=745368 RepID=UPI00195DFB3A|nr:fructose-1,6-bisphosphatase [Gemmiger formicilis]MBM6717994.1 fructose-1,6-bisphosphatase [Gemmiger formicilis]
MADNGEQLRYLQLLSKDFPTIAAAASEIIRIEALLRLPKGTEHFMSDLHGEHEAFLHILNNASGVIREKIDLVLGDSVPAHDRAELATLIYYPVQKLPEIKAKQTDLDGWYRRTLLQLIELCRLVSSKHTRAHVRKCLPANCGYILDELLHAHFEDHDKDLYYGQIIDSILRYERADAYIIRFCEVIKHLAVDTLHILGDMFDRGARPDLIMDQLIAHHDVDIQWGNHDVVWMGAAAGSAVCVFTVLKTSLAYGNLDLIETGYGISLRGLERFAMDFYGGPIDRRWIPHADDREHLSPDVQTRNARMHKAVTLLMFKLEAGVIARNPDFRMQGRDYLNHIDYEAGTVTCHGQVYPLLDRDFPTVDPADPTALTPREQALVQELCRAFTQSERLQRHVQFLYAHGAVYKVFNGNLLFHGAVPMTEDGAFAPERFEGRLYSGKALFDYCDRRARQGYFAPPDSPERRAGQDFLWYLWCGALSPIFGRSAMTTFERLYIADESTHAEIKNPYYKLVSGPRAEEIAVRILAEFGLSGEGCHILNGHVPVRAVEGEDPVKAGGRLVVIDGGFCRAYHRRTGIAGYTLVYNSRGMTLRTHQPFESTAKAILEDEDIASKSKPIYVARERILVRDTDEGRAFLATIADLSRLLDAYRAGVLVQHGD